MTVPKMTTQANAYHTATHSSLEVTCALMCRDEPAQGPPGQPTTCPVPAATLLFTPSHALPRPSAVSVSAAHGPLRPTPPPSLPAAPLLANPWLAAPGLLAARAASCRFPGTGRDSSFQGPVGSVTSQGGLPGLRSVPLVQTHLADKRGFESLRSHLVAHSRQGHFAQEQRLACQ